MTTLPASQQIKENTARYHERVETAMNSEILMSRDISFNFYKKTILRQYFAHQIIEEKLQLFSEIALHEEFAQKTRWKLPLLKQDLKILDINEEDLPKPMDIHFTLENPFEAWGAAYVLEGATMGGKYIFKHLKEHKDQLGVDEFHYFNCYDIHIAHNWKSFKNAIDSLASGQKEIDLAVNGAKKAYNVYFSICENTDLINYLASKSS